MNPYTDIDADTRKFTKDIDATDLVWHRDREDRIIESIFDTDWLIQIENELPKNINRPISIKSGVWHRLIKGTGDLTLKIIKENG